MGLTTPGGDCVIRAHLIRVLLVCLALSPLGAGCSGSRPAWVQQLGYRSDEVMPIQVGEYGFPYVPVKVGDTERQWLFDTGDMFGIGIAEAEARKLGLGQAGDTLRLDSAGNASRSSVYRIGQLTVFGSTLRDQQALVYEGNDVPGGIGPGFLVDKRFTLDYRHRLLAIAASPLPAPPRGSVTLPLLPTGELQGLIVVEGSVGGRPLYIEVDTGKSRTCIDPELVAELGLVGDAGGYPVKSIRLGTFHFDIPSAKAVSFRGISRHLPESVLLSIGSDVLSKVVTTVDYRQKVMVIMPPE